MNGFYINLEKREDRKEKIEELQSKYHFFHDIQRFNAISNEDGRLGVYLSHIQCLELCLQMEDEYFLIMEDDFFICNDLYYKDFLKDFSILQKNKDWDIFLFTNSIKDNEKEPFFQNFNRTFNFLTATGYIIRKSFIPILLQNWKEGIELFLKTKKCELYCVDVYWRILNRNHIFISYHKDFTIQYPSYSDIERKNVNYFNYNI